MLGCGYGSREIISTVKILMDAVAVLAAFTSVMFLKTSVCSVVSS